MDQIKRMTTAQRYDVLDLWFRCTTKENPFIEENFWQKHYDEVKNNYLTLRDNYVYMVDGNIAGFICITNKNFIKGLFVDPAYRKRGIGAKLMRFAKQTYNVLHVNVYTKNRDMLAFSTYMGFVIDGALLHRDTGEIRYRMIWSENNNA